MQRVLTLACATLLSANAAAALPVIPDAVGFGIETPAGRGGKIFRVTNLQANGAGSLHECIAASGPRICVFEVSGVIRLTSNLSVRNPFLTIAGQTAPAPGIMIRGGGLGIHASNVLVQHISVRPGDDPDESKIELRDALAIDANNGPIKGVVIDHCSFSWSNDEIMDVYREADSVTLSNNIFSEPLDHLNPDGSHTLAALVGSDTGRIALIGNLFAHANDRNARSGAEQFVFVNNVIYNHGWTGSHLFSKGRVTMSSLVGNLYLKGPSSLSKAASIRFDSNPENTLVFGSKIFLSDNIGDRPDGLPASSDPWSIVSNGSALSRAVLETDSPPAWPAGLVARSTANNGVLQYVLANAGSRPAERSAVDARIVGHVRNGTGRIINCVEDNGTAACGDNAGGWPSYAQNRRVLELPTNPHGDSNSDGYTNVEEWLHQLAAEVEGRTSIVKPRAPLMSVE